MPEVIRERCPQDHACPCVGMCPVEAITQKGFEAPVIDKKKCIECGMCTNFCPYKAITEITEENSHFMDSRL